MQFNRIFQGFKYSEVAQRDLVEKVRKSFEKNKKTHTLGFSILFNPQVLKHPTSVRYPPSRSYRTHFLKTLIGKVSMQCTECRQRGGDFLSYSYFKMHT